MFDNYVEFLTEALVCSKDYAARPLRLAKLRVPMCTRRPDVACNVPKEVAIKRMTAPV